MSPRVLISSSSARGLRAGARGYGLAATIKVRRRKGSAARRPLDLYIDTAVCRLRRPVKTTASLERRRRTQLSDALRQLHSFMPPDIEPHTWRPERKDVVLASVVREALTRIYKVLHGTCRLSAQTTEPRAPAAVSGSGEKNPTPATPDAQPMTAILIIDDDIELV